MDDMKVKPYPVWLNKTEVLMGAIKWLEEMKSGVQLFDILDKALKGPGKDSAITDDPNFRSMKESIPDAALQIKVMDEAIVDLKAFALEERLVRARAENA